MSDPRFVFTPKVSFLEKLIGGAVGFVIFLVLAFGISLISALIARPIWNYLAPTFSLPHLGYWQVFWMLYLCSMLFKGSTSTSK